ncbi:isoleucine--tRNA ligase [Mechercharimyces sp. CAU 1602]|uniref:isoleucine--tRNA ligase n=1 Tax=Mechercharimyces sp. CAU 1602 TaxID=2973933 RepID=UPI0021615D09|nr:isoleucine--tRNA ligase [Mechercharimyces sp. CAU 1602]MCS1350639.1 isoleucine--tRNA ligase [Mechercharimyces sp. CAU 1602]
MDYKQTLNLPQTDFPMRGNLPQREPEMQSKWLEMNLYQLRQEKNEGKPTFTLHDGPPYANGDLHIGHALNKTLKDFIVRYKSMAGFRAPFVIGWDTHGMPIENAMIKKKKVKRKEVDPVAFRQMCKEYALSFVEKQKMQFRRIGISDDPEYSYVTLQPEYEAEQIRLFGKMVQGGHVYRGLKTISWSPTSETALAEAEIEYADKRSASIYVAFSVQNGNGVVPADSEFVIWTTTPWTIPANLGIAVNADFSYSLLEAEGRKLIVAKELATEVMETIGVSEWKEVACWQGSELEGVVCAHPFYQRQSPVLLGEHVTLESGTGCVHTAPGHGEDDFLLGKKYGLDILCPVNEKGVFTEQAPGFAGLFYEEGNKAVTEKLKEEGALLHLGFITHQYPHDWRTKKPIIFRATEQWFASIDGFREQMLTEIEKVEWKPAWGEVRLHNMIRDRGDWCISRQRIWGVPLPIFYCDQCREPHITEESIHHIATLFAQEGSSSWFAKEVDQLLPPGATCGACGGTQFVKETDTMDVWFDSGSSHAAVLESREDLSFPADLYLEGSDQYRGWFNSSLSTSVATNGKAPYKQVVSHGFTLDDKGRKMSKSLGNTIDPQKVIQQYGADILRLWVSSVDYQADMRVSDKILKQIAEAYRKIRNTFRFLLGNVADFDIDKDRIQAKSLEEIDRYALVKLQRLVQDVEVAYDRYEFHQVYSQVHKYCVVFLSQFYLDILKDRLYTLPQDDHVRRSAQTVLYETLVVLAKLLAPIIPHTADEVWQYIQGIEGESVHLQEWPQLEAEEDLELETRWDEFIELRGMVLKSLEEARAQKIIGNSLGAAVHLYPSTENAALLEKMGELTQLFITSAVKVHQPDGGEGLRVEVKPAEGDKCERCWMISPTVGKEERHPTLCDRCVGAVTSI